MSTTRPRTLAIAVVAAIGAAILLVMTPLVAGAVAGRAAVADAGPPGGRLGDATIGRHPDSNLVLALRPTFAELASCAELPQTCADAGGDFGYGAALRTALITSALTAAAFLFTMVRTRRTAVGVPPEPALDPAARAASEPLPDDVLAAIPARVTAVTHFGQHGGFVDAHGVLVWAALIRPGEPIYPGRALTVLSSSHERDSLLVTPAVARDTRAMTADRVRSG